MKISNMKKRFTFLLLFCCFFGFSQISVNELVSLAKKDDIPGDIFDFFNRKGFIYSRKESLKIMKWLLDYLAYFHVSYDPLIGRPSHLSFLGLLHHLQDYQLNKERFHRLLNY